MYGGQRPPILLNVSDSADLPQFPGVLDTVRAWLSSADPRPLVLTGPPGSGTAALLARLREHLAGEPSVVVCDDLCDDPARLPARPGLRVITRARRRHDGPLSLPVRPLRGHGPGSEVVRHFLRCLRRRDPTAVVAAEDLSQVSQVCAASFGLSADVDLLAGLVARYGLAAVRDAVAEDHQRTRLAGLLGDAHGHHDLSGDEMVVLASILALPGGASENVLRHSLPRCDIGGLTASLVERGLVVRAEPRRWHLRVSGFPAASWCAARPEVSLDAIRQAQADYLSGQVARLAAGVFTDNQRAVFAEFDHERRNLNATLAELVGGGRYAQAVALMRDALPLLARTSGVAGLLPHLLPVIRRYSPATPAERHTLSRLAVRVFAAGGEQEAAAVCFDALPETDPDVPLLAALVQAGPDPEALAACVRTARDQGDAVRLGESVGEYVACLVRLRRFDHADAECRTALFEAMCGGDDHAAGSLLLWRAAAATALATGDGRLYVERALAKLLPLGPAAAMSAVAAVLDGRHQRDLQQSAVDLAMVAGSLSRACAAESERPVEAGSLLAGRVGVRPVRRWVTAGEGVDLADLLCEILQRRFGDDPAAPRPVLQGGVDPRVLRERSRLTARESEVAGLVATGLTNKQIARRLRISEWTVVNHLRQVMRKLDCASRVQVARWVHDLEAGSARLEPADGDGVQQGRVDQRGEVGGDAAGVQRGHQPEVPVDVRRGVDSAGEEFRVLLRHGQGRLVQFGRGGEHAVPDPRDQPPVDVTFAEPR